MDERYTPSETYLNRPYAIILIFIELEKIKYQNFEIKFVICTKF